MCKRRLKHLGNKAACNRDIVRNFIEYHNITKTDKSTIQFFGSDKNQSAHACSIIKWLIIDILIKFL